MQTRNRMIVNGCCLALLGSGIAAAQGQMPKTTTQKVAGATTTKTEQLRGTVDHVEGGTLVVKMASGDIRMFTPPASRRFLIDGREVTLAELKPGTRLNATVVTSTTPVTERTTTVGTGKVWFVSGTNVILTLPNGENRQYKVTDDYKFTIEGNKNATVFDLRKGMVVSAQKIVETPRFDIATDTQVSGTAPRSTAEVAKAAPASPPPTPAAAPAAARPTARPAARPVETETAPTTAKLAPAPAEQDATPMPKKLPKTGSPMPLIGLLGLACGSAALVIRRLR